MNSQSFTITKGPSKFDLSIALLSDIKDGKYPHSVEFAVFDPTIGGPAIQKVVVLSIEAEDGSRESWNIADYKIWGDDAKRFTGRYVKIYFRTDRPVAVCSSWTEQPPNPARIRKNAGELFYDLSIQLLRHLSEIENIRYYQMTARFLGVQYILSPFTTLNALLYLNYANCNGPYN